MSSIATDNDQRMEMDCLDHPDHGWILRTDRSSLSQRCESVESLHSDTNADKRIDPGSCFAFTQSKEDPLRHEELGSPRKGRRERGQHEGARAPLPAEAFPNACHGAYPSARHLVHGLHLW